MTQQIFVCRQGDNSAIVATDSQKNTGKARADKIQRRHSFPSLFHKRKLLAEFYVSDWLFFSAVYILAKQHGVKNPESFGLLLAEHFLNKVTLLSLAKLRRIIESVYTA
jgi:urate oxidase